MTNSKQTKAEVLAALVAEGMADTPEEVLADLADMGITWQDVRDGRWF